MCVWTIVMLEYWKRRESELALSWGTIDFEAFLKNMFFAFFRKQVTRDPWARAFGTGPLGPGLGPGPWALGPGLWARACGAMSVPPHGPPEAPVSPCESLGGDSGFNVYNSTRMVHRDFMKLLVNRTQVAPNGKIVFMSFIRVIIL